MDRPCSKAAGFTLVELLVVGLLIAALAGLAVPRFRGSVEYLRLRQQTRRVGDMMRQARDLARTWGCPVWLRVDEQGRCAWMERETGREEKPFAVVEGGPAGRLCGVGQLVLEGDEEGLVFLPDGRRGLGTVRLRGEGKNGFVIALRGELGRVEIQNIEE